MKTAVLPQVWVEPELRDLLESMLREGETLSDFVETSVRNALEFRRLVIAFHGRGEFAWRAYERTGAMLPAAQVFDQLQARIEERRGALRARG